MVCQMIFQFTYFPASPFTTMRIQPPFLTLITTLLLLHLNTPSSYSIPYSQSGPGSGVSISVSPKILSKSENTVHVHWTGIDSPSKLDWLGIYSPPDSPHDNFIGYVFLSANPTHLFSGSGSVSLPLPNLRSNYSFRVFRWSESDIDPTRIDHDNNPIPGSDHFLAGSDEVGYRTVHGAEQIHLAFTDRVDEMRVVFVTGDGGERYVRYGRSERGGEGRRRRRREWEGWEVTRVERYEREDMCDSPANESVGWRDPGWIHDAVMKGLRKGVRYYYQVGSDSAGWSATHSFVSRDPDSDETIAFIFGDMGTATPYSTFYRTQDESIATVKWILRDIKALGDKPTFISHIGDISYARGYSWVWDHFFTQTEPIAANVPYHVCIGNHEYDWPLQPWRPEWATNVYKTDGGGECGVPYSLRFKMPGNSSEPTGTRAPATRNLYYSFDFGVVHFVYFSTETNFLPGSRQYDFLKNDLESVDRNKTPFVVVQGHRPMYTSSYAPKDAPVRERMMEHLEPLFVKNKVTLVLWGHVHRYERFCPIKNFTCASSAGEDGEALPPIHAVIGMGGQDWQPVWEPRPNHPKDPIYPQPNWSLYRSGEFGYTRLVATREKLTLSYVGNHDGKVHDMVEIVGSRRAQSGHADGAGSKFQVVESMPSCFPGVMVMIMVAFMGYIVGVISRSKQVAMARHGWIPVKNEEI